MTKEEKKLPIFLGEGDEQIQIGYVSLSEWQPGDPEYTRVFVNLDVFPGEYASLARVVKWEEEIVQVAEDRILNEWDKGEEENKESDTDEQ